MDAAEAGALFFRRVDVPTPEGSPLLADAQLAWKVPAAQIGKLPVVTLGDRFLVGPEAVAKQLPEWAERWKRGEGRTAPRLPLSGPKADAARKAAIKANAECGGCTEAPK